MYTLIYLGDHDILFLHNCTFIYLLHVSSWCSKQFPIFHCLQKSQFPQVYLFRLPFFFLSKIHYTYRIQSPYFILCVCVSVSCGSILFCAWTDCSRVEGFLKWPLGEGLVGHSETGRGEEEQLALLSLWVNTVQPGMGKEEEEQSIGLRLSCPWHRAVEVPRGIILKRDEC